MEDRYLFKAKKTDSEEWVIGYYGVIGKRNVIIEKYVENYYCPDTCKFRHGNQIHEVNSKTICQCTGLRDKNGKLIWENDIVKDLFSDVCAKIKYGSYQNCFDSTKTEHVGFYVGWSNKHTGRYRKDLGYWINMVDAEIVGNIFDNPELLESEE